ncbi:sugar transferase [Paracoccus aerius]|uniref:sugar transferase n=1 Tax=Paracoccus aerius TaxID=1915382 RepID=UPI003606DDF0
MTIHHDWDRTGSARVAMPKMAWFAGDAQGSAANPAPRRKRLFDLTLALVLLIPLSVVMGIVAVLLLIQQGRPILYFAERMRAPGQPFTQLKFRTMIGEDKDRGQPERTSIGASRPWAGSCAAAAWTSCRSFSTSCAAT